MSDSKMFEQGCYGKKFHNPIGGYVQLDLHPHDLCLEQLVQCLEANVAKGSGPP
jgi:hypothetical protein